MTIDARREREAPVGALLIGGAAILLLSGALRIAGAYGPLVASVTSLLVNLLAWWMAGIARVAAGDGGAARAWRLMGIAALASAVAGLGHIVQAVAGWPPAGAPPTDALYGAFYAVIFVAVIAFPRRAGGGFDWTGWFDVATVILAGGLLLVDLVLGPALVRARVDGSAWSWGLALYPLVDLLILAAIARAAALATVPASQRALVLLVPAMLAILTADIANARLELIGRAGTAPWVDLCWDAGSYLLAVAAAAEYGARVRRGGVWRIHLGVVDAVGAALPYTVVAAAFGLLIDASFGWGLGGPGLPGQVGLPAIAITVTVIAALVAVRQVVAVRRRAVAEQVTRRTERRFRALLERGRDLAFIVDEGGTVRYASPSVSVVLGIEPAALTGVPLATLLDADSAALAAARLATAIPEPIAGGDTSLRFRAASGHLTEHAVSFRNLCEDPAIGGIVVTAHDVSEERGRFRSLEARYRDVADAVQEIIFEADAERRFTFVSPAWSQVTGYPVESVIGRSVWAFVGDDEAARIRHAPSPDETFAETVRMPAADGTSRWIDVRSRSRFDGEGRFTGIFGIARDITAQREAAEALAAARDAADHANRAKSEFVSRMSHELRTPLNSIIGYAELLHLQSLEPDDQVAVERVLEAGRHLLALINEVLDMARLEAGRLVLEIEPVSVKASVDAAVALVQRLADANRIALVNHATPLLAGVLAQANVLADRRRLLQVFLNLLTNAIKYNRPRGTVWIVLDEPEPGFVRINIRDTGPGIPREDRERLFVPFERLGAERGSVDGTGLGLSVARSLVEEMHGQIDVTSTPSGSTFGIRLPVTTLAERRSEVAPSALPPEPVLATATRRVLVVEDNEPNRDLLCRVLERVGNVRVAAASSGAAALEAAHATVPDLVLLDLGLPDMDGADVLRRLRQDGATAGIPVAILSADATDERRSELLAAGAVRYLTKPYSVLEIQAAIAELLGGDAASTGSDSVRPGV